jgi:hypothetical protein
MKYSALKELKDKEIRRLTGVKRSTFVKIWTLDKTIP